MKIFITGGTGFIGGYVLQALQRHKNIITAITRESNQRVKSVDSKIVWLNKPMDKLTEIDFEGVDVLLHMASVGVSPKIAKLSELFYWNVSVPLEMVNRAIRAGVRRIVVTGSYAEYGLTANDYEFIPANAPLLPTNPYASSKAASFLGFLALAKQKNIEFSYLRIFSAYGEGQSLVNFWPSLRHAALTGNNFEMTPGEQIRDFIRVEKVAEEIVLNIFRLDMCPGLVIIKNVGSGTQTTLQNFAKKNWDEMGAKGVIINSIPYRDNEQMRFVPDLKEIRL